jgi:hypothetical protein
MPNPQNIEKHKFKKGVSGNLNGHPKGVKNRSTILKKWMELYTKLKNPVTGKDEAGTVEDKVQLALITKALSGDVAAIKEINDTLYGKIQEKIELDEKLTIEWKETKTYLKNDSDS